MEQHLKLENFAALKDIASEFGMLGDDYMVALFEPSALTSDLLAKPTCIAGLTYCLFKKGNASVTIDFKDMEIAPNSLMVINSNTRFSINSMPEPGTRCYLVNFSPKFLHDLNFDLHSLNLHEFVEQRPSPVIRLSTAEFAMAEHLVQVLLHNPKVNLEQTFSVQIARSVTQATIYQLLQISSNRSARPITNTDSPNGTRQLAYVQEFMRQLQLHHCHHRAIAFYADKLCISQKYLSHIIKEVTGRSATDWIAEYVVMEAKNQLRFSNKNVQQVAYSLNFPTQSSFGKYFKHVTGISPSEFQKG